MQLMSRFTHLLGAAVVAAGVTFGLSNAANAESMLDRVIAQDKVRVGISLDLPPFGMKTLEGEPEGVDVDVAKRLAEKLGVKLEIVDTTSADRIPNLRSGKIDVMLGSFTGTPERAKVVSFSDPYVTAQVLSLGVSKDSKTSSVDDLKNGRIAVTKGTTQDLMITPLFPDAHIMRFDTEAAALFALAQGQVDGFFCDGNVLNYQAKMNPKIKVLADKKYANVIEYQRLGVPRGDQEWLNWINMFAFDLGASGTADKLYHKWFNAEMPAPLNPTF